MNIQKIFLFMILSINLNFVNAQYTPSFTVNKNPANYCRGEKVVFTNHTTGSYELLTWKFGNNLYSYGETVTHSYQSSGTYTAWLIAIYPGGIKDSTSISINVLDKPNITLLQDTIAQSLTARTGQAGLDYTWFFKGIDTNNNDSVLYYLEAGYYWVIARNNSGCYDSVGVKITFADTSQNIAGSVIVVRNNILTPGIQDGANDVMFINDLGNFSSPCEVLIFNRWGQQVYSNSNYTNAGGFKGQDDSGKDLDAGTYYYIVKSIGRKGGTGYIDIIR